MTSLRVLFCVLALAIVAVAAADPQPFTATVTGSTVNGTYVSYPTVAVTTPDTLAGTVTVALSPDTQISAAVTVCFSANPIFSASNLAALCPQGGLVTVSNNTAALVEVKFARKSFSAFSSTKRLSGRFAQKADEVLDTTNTVTLLPATSYFVVFATGTTSEDVSLTLSGATCAQGEVGPACVTPAPIAANDTAPVEVGPNAYTYFMVDPTTFDASVGSVTYALGAAPTAAAGVAAAAAAAAPAGLALFAQVGTLPTSASAAQVIGSGSTITIESPSTLSGTLYIGVQNTGAAATNATLTSTANSCPANTYGASCTPLSSIALLSAALSTNVQKLSKSSSTTNPLVSFQVDTTTIPAGAAAVRVSVSSSTSTTADAVYAKLGSPPTVTDYAYRVSGGYVNQLVLLVPAAPPAAADNFNASAWYVAVDATNDYSIWAGNNCAGNCNSWNQTSTANNNGYCVCNGAPCDATTSYEVPAPNAVDSFGVCQCKDTKKQNNYDCSALVETSSPFKTVYIVLIAVGGAIVLAVAIGVPVYCYLQNRKRDYERL